MIPRQNTASSRVYGQKAYFWKRQTDSLRRLPTERYLVFLDLSVIERISRLAPEIPLELPAQPDWYEVSADQLYRIFYLAS